MKRLVLATLSLPRRKYEMLSNEDAGAPHAVEGPMSNDRNERAPYGKPGFQKLQTIFSPYLSRETYV